MARMIDKRPTYYMPNEKRAYARGWRHGLAGIPRRPLTCPAAYNRGFNDGYAEKVSALAPQPSKQDGDEE